MFPENLFVAKWSVSTVFILICTLHKISAIIYQDFEEFDSNDTLQYGILNIGNDEEFFRSTRDGSSVPQMQSIYINFGWQYNNNDQYNRDAEGGISTNGWKNQGSARVNMSGFCEIPTMLVGKRKIFLELDFYKLGEIADCLTDSGKNLSGLILIMVPQPLGQRIGETDYSAVREVQRLGASLGFREMTARSAQNTFLNYKKVGLTAKYIVFDLKINDRVYYDYNKFASFLNEQSIVSRFSGFDFTPILYLHPSFQMQAYDYLIFKFLYRWGENEKHMVIYGRDFCDFVQTNITGNSGTDVNPLQANLNKPLWFPLVSNSDELNSTQLKSPLSCSYIDSFMVMLQSYKSINFKGLLELASVHSNFPCKITWIIRWLWDFQSTGTQEPYTRAGIQKFQKDFRKTMKFLSMVTKRHPNLIVNIYLLIQVDNRLNGTAVEIEINKKLQFVTETMKISPTLYDRLYLYSILSGIERGRRQVAYYNSTNAGMSALLAVKDSVSASYLNTLSEEFTMTGAKPVLVDLFWYTEKGGERDGCYEYKINFLMAKNWADVNGYDLLQFAYFSIFGGNVWPIGYSKPWIKNAFIFGNDFNAHSATKEELKFLSNLKDTCVTMNEEVPSNAVLFSDSYSGITFVLTTEKYANMGAEEIAMLLKLIHFKFLTVEIVVEQFEFIHTIYQAIALVESELGDPGIPKKYNYFLNLAFAELSMISDVPQRSNGITIAGLHATFCWCAQDLANIQSLKQNSAGKTGMSFSYEEARNIVNHDVWAELVPLLDYSVIRVNIADALFKERNSSATDIDLYKAFSFNLENENQYLPNPVFDNLRAFRFNFKRINPNITVYLQIAWPTMDNKKSMERTQKMWAFLREFSEEFNFPFFLYQAFDNATNLTTTQSDLKYGWWKLENDLAVGDPNNYIDRQAEFYDLETQRPKPKTKIKPSETTQLPTLEIGIGFVAFLLVIIGISTLVIYRLRRTLHSMLTKEEIRQFEHGGMEFNQDHPHYETDYCSNAYDRKRYEIEKCAFNFDSSTPIGSGHFGVVFKTTIPNYDKPVAVKVPKIGAKHELLSVLREIKLMSYIGEHINVLKLVGAYTREIQNGVVYVITEFAENGSLLDYLRNMKKIEYDKDDAQFNFYRFCYEISNGMQFLAEKKVVHGDLSARNVLLDENNCCKICDFGLSRKLYVMQLYVKSSSEPVPWKWMAIETLERSELSLKSDIWSLGVTIWEIFSFGQEPYMGMSYDMQFNKKIIDGFRLPKPEMADPNIYEVLLSCWQITPDDRPSARDLLEFFESLQNSAYIFINEV